eukprot:jgi/Tetstr1/431133/TSEL_020847.t1
MGAPKQKWTEEEEAALRAGVVKYGVGKWRAIQKDPGFKTALSSRTNVDLKDKWRNLTFDPQLSPKKVAGDKRGRSKSADTVSGRGKKIAYYGNGHFIDGSDAKKLYSASSARSSLDSTPSPRSSKLACPFSVDPFAANLSVLGGVDVDEALERLEDATVAAIIARSGGSGSTATEILGWLQEHCPSRRASSLRELQPTLSKLVAQRRLAHAGGRFKLAGFTKKYADEERLDLLPPKGWPRMPDGALRRVPAQVAAMAARAISDAEEAAARAARLSKEAEMLEAKHGVTAVTETARDDKSPMGAPISMIMDAGISSGGSAVVNTSTFMIFGTPQGAAQLIASV